jgi:galactokinase
MNGYFALVRASGHSSALWLQNTKIEGMPEHQPLHIALALSEHFLGNEGAARVQGGGFAGTIQAYVRLNRVDDYMAFMDDVFGDSSCTVVRLRTAGLTMKALDAGQ